MQSVAGEMIDNRCKYKNPARALLVAAALVGGAPLAFAASPVDRSLNLKDSQFELGLGAGLGHEEPSGYTGFGLNLELGYGITSSLELRVRTGLRFNVPARTTRADKYGRPVETETYNTGGGTVANPEVGLRFSLVRGGTAEIALDGKVYLPLDGPFGLMAGLPVALRLGSRLKLDTGIFIPMLFYERGTAIDVSLPLHFWIKLDGGTFLGPITGVVFQNDGPNRVPFGFGIGTPLSYDADIRAWLLFPDISRDGGAKNWGTGIGLYVDF